MAILSRDDDTICAVATPPGKGGISVIRVSGDLAYKATKKLCSFLPETPESHKVHYGVLKGSSSDIDEVLVTFFQKGRSFTGEDTVEISTHGSPTISSLVLTELIELGVRMAQPGEFTYRAFVSGRIDLVQAEGVLEIIESQSPKSTRLALKQLQGHHSEELKKIEDELTWVLAHCEANIDFASEDIESAEASELKARVLTIHKAIQNLISGYKYGKGIKDGLFISLLGYPNVGKSSLLNSFVGFDRAIVTNTPGTTRDVIEEEVWFQGFRLKFSDTAGVRDSNDEIEKIGIQRTLEMVDQSDKVLMVLDLSQSLQFDLDKIPFNKEFSENLVLVFNKADISVNSQDAIEKFVSELCKKIGLGNDESLSYFKVSAKEKSGLHEVLEFLVGEYQSFSESQESAVILNARHRELLEKALNSCDRTVELMDKDQSPEFVAFELQGGLMAIQEILGKQFDDEVMDRVFREFCLGK